MPRETYLITLDRPEGASIKDVTEYLLSAAMFWGGQFHPDDPLFGMHQANISVLRATPKRLDTLRSNK